MGKDVSCHRLGGAQGRVRTRRRRGAAEAGSAYLDGTEFHDSAMYLLLIEQIVLLVVLLLLLQQLLDLLLHLLHLQLQRCANASRIRDCAGGGRGWRWGD